MEKQVTHICLLNEDPSAILSPIIDCNIPSHKLVIAATQRYRRHAKQIIMLANNRGYKAQYKQIPDTLDVNALKCFFIDIFSEFDDVHNELWFNATNGHRIHSLVAFKIASSLSIPSYVVNEQNDCLHWISSSDLGHTEIQDKMKLSEYVQLYRAVLTSRHHISSDLKKKELGKKWALKAEKLSSSLANLNYLASTSNSANFVSKPLNQAQIHDSHLTEILNDLAALNIVELQNNRVCFLNSDNKFFCNGGWLEELVYALVFELQKEVKTIHDIAHSAILQRNYGKKTVENEIDVAALVNNKLHIIECKTKRFLKNEGANTLYKLDSINDLLGGIRGRACLISYFPLSDGEKLRAYELSIKVFDVALLKNLKHHLKLWLAGA